MIEVVNPFDSTGFTGKKKADQTGRRNFFGRACIKKRIKSLFLDGFSGKFSPWWYKNSLSTLNMNPCIIDFCVLFYHWIGLYFAF